MINFGNVILFHRKKSGLSRKRLALLADVGKTAIFNIEHGKKEVRFSTILKIFDVLNIKIRVESPFMDEWEATNE